MVQDAHETQFCVQERQGRTDEVGQGKGSLAGVSSFAGFGFLCRDKSFGFDEARMAMEGGGNRVKLNT